MKPTPSPSIPHLLSSSPGSLSPDGVLPPQYPGGLNRPGVPPGNLPPTPTAAPQYERPLSIVEEYIKHKVVEASNDLPFLKRVLALIKASIDETEVQYNRELHALDGTHPLPEAAPAESSTGDGTDIDPPASPTSLGNPFKRAEEQPTTAPPLLVAVQIPQPTTAEQKHALSLILWAKWLTKSVKPILSRKIKQTPKAQHLASQVIKRIASTTMDSPVGSDSNPQMLGELEVNTDVIFCSRCGTVNTYQSAETGVDCFQCGEHNTISPELHQSAAASSPAPSPVSTPSSPDSPASLGDSTTVLPEPEKKQRKGRVSSFWSRMRNSSANRSSTEGSSSTPSALNSILTQDPAAAASERRREQEEEERQRTQKDPELDLALRAEHIFFMAQEKFRSALELDPTSALLFAEWGRALRRHAFLCEAYIKDYSIAFLLLLCAGEFFQRSLEIQASQPRILNSWGKVIDAIAFLKPTDRGGISLCRRFLSFYEKISQEVSAEVAEALSLKPIIALTVSEFDNALQNQALNVLRVVSKNSPSPNLRKEARHNLRYIEAIVRGLQRRVVIPNDPYGSLPDEAKRVARQAGISVEEINEHWQTFLFCLSFSSHIRVSGFPYHRHRAFGPKQVSYSSNPFEEDFVGLENPSRLFKNIEKIDKGGFGDVYIARRIEDNQRVAIKVMKPQAGEQSSRVQNEINILRSCRHENIVRHFESYLVGKEVWVVMEWCDGGSLYHLLRDTALDEPQISFISREILSGLAYMHSRNLVHRDIKSDNVLLNLSGSIKIADLGECTQVKACEAQMEMVGSRYWMAPEMLRGRPYGCPIDVYSFGCVVIEMADGQPPYYDLHQLKAVFLTATRGAPPLRSPDRWSQTFLDFLAQCLTPDPAIRPTAQQLLRHPFLRLTCPAKRIRSIFETCFLGHSLKPMH